MIQTANRLNSVQEYYFSRKLKEVRQLKVAVIQFKLAFIMILSVWEKVKNIKKHMNKKTR